VTALEVMTLREQGADAPSVIKVWFLPGQTTGYESIYPKESAQLGGHPKPAISRHRKTGH